MTSLQHTQLDNTIRNAIESFRARESSLPGRAQEKITDAVQGSPSNDETLLSVKQLADHIFTDISQANLESMEARHEIDPTRVALLMETRALSVLPALIAHFISVLPQAWTVRFVGSQEAIAVVSASAPLRIFVTKGKLIITELPGKYSIATPEQISTTLSDLAFYRDFLAPAEWLLIFQTDSMICAASKKTVDDWVSQNFTWVGAPWNAGNAYGGNGGLSLRHVPDIVNVLQRHQRAANDLPEDRWFSDHLGTMEGTNMPPPAVTRAFSVESLWAERPLGYHLRSSGTWEHLDQGIWGDAERRQAIFDYCPEVKLILDLEFRQVVEEQDNTMPSEGPDVTDDALEEDSTDESESIGFLNEIKLGIDEVLTLL